MNILKTINWIKEHFLQLVGVKNELGIKGDRDSNGVLLADCTGVKVVGNVFDNPELITDKSK